MVDTTRRGLVRSAAIGGAGVAGVRTASRPAAAQEAPYDGWFTDATGGATDNYAGSTSDQTGQDQVSVTVGGEGNGGPFAFAPAAIRISPGTEVVFRWVSDNHNVLLEAQPDGADWGGHEPIENTGFEFSHTFETEGVYKYYCQPHLSLGMKGAIVVGDVDVGETAAGAATPTPRSAGQPLVPGADVGTILFVLTAGAGAFAVLAAGGPEAIGAARNYRRRRRDATPATAVEESPAPTAATELDHDEYDPTGTLRLIVGYFLVLVGMWVIMYFVEFLGNGPTIIG
jgi:halocyanin-like protein